MKKVLIEVTDELMKAIDAARGDAPRNPWLESQLWKRRAIADAAKQIGVAKPDRPADGRGRKATK